MNNKNNFLWPEYVCIFYHYSYFFFVNTSQNIYFDLNYELMKTLILSVSFDRPYKNSERQYHHHFNNNSIIIIIIKNFNDISKRLNTENLHFSNDFKPILNHIHLLTKPNIAHLQNRHFQQAWTIEKRITNTKKNCTKLKYPTFRKTARTFRTFMRFFPRFFYGGPLTGGAGASGPRQPPIEPWMRAHWAPVGPQRARTRPFVSRGIKDARNWGSFFSLWCDYGSLFGCFFFSGWILDFLSVVFDCVVDEDRMGLFVSGFVMVFIWKYFLVWFVDLIRWMI